VLSLSAPAVFIFLLFHESYDIDSNTWPHIVTGITLTLAVGATMLAVQGRRTTRVDTIDRMLANAAITVTLVLLLGTLLMLGAFLPDILGSGS
jgi:hypothetical protein